jgi:Methylamine utilisation protein MauE
LSIDHLILFFSRAVLIVAFGTAGLTKLLPFRWRQLPAFANSLEDVAPRVLVTPRQRLAAAALVAVAETSACLLLLLPWTSVPGLILASTLLLCFTVVIATVVRRGATAACNCFGSGGSPLSTSHIARNGLLLVVVAAGIATELLTHGVPALPDYDSALALGLGLIIGFCFTRWDDLVFIAMRSRPTPTGSWLRETL